MWFVLITYILDFSQIILTLNDMFVECNGYLPIAVTLFATTLVAMFCLSGEKPNNSVIKPRSRSNSPYYYQSDSESDDE